MKAIRKIIDHTVNPLTIELPEEYRNRKVEVVILPVEEEETKKNMTFQSSLAKWSGKEMLLRNKGN